MPANDTSTTKNTHHCYLLQSLSSPTKTYIGYTVNPFRRLKQHNGLLKGGAKYTSKFRPWKFISITQGFKTEPNGLQFEWAWQHPKRSKIFRNGLGGGGGMALAGMLEKQPGYNGRLRLLMILLCESQEFKNESLHVYFFEGEKLMEFNGLFNDFEEDEGEEEWCKVLPAQMGTTLVESVEDMPFYRDILSRRKRPRKESARTRTRVTTSTFSDGSNSENDNDNANDNDNLMYVEERSNVVEEDLNIDGNDGSDFDFGIQDICQIQRLSIGRNGREEDLKSDISDSSSVIDLLDSSDDENVQTERLGGNTDQGIDMDLCSPARTTNDSHSTIDLISPTSTRTNNNLVSILNLSLESLNRFGDHDSDSSDGTIDLCSPQKENIRI